MTTLIDQIRADILRFFAEHPDWTPVQHVYELFESKECCGMAAIRKLYNKPAFDAYPNLTIPRYWAFIYGWDNQTVSYLSAEERAFHKLGQELSQQLIPSSSETSK